MNQPGYATGEGLSRGSVLGTALAWHLFDGYQQLSMTVLRSVKCTVNPDDPSVEQMTDVVLPGRAAFLER